MKDKGERLFPEVLRIYVEEVCTIGQACKKAGICEDTFYKVIKIGDNRQKYQEADDARSKRYYEKMRKVTETALERLLGENVEETKIGRAHV